MNQLIVLNKTAQQILEKYRDFARKSKTFDRIDPENAEIFSEIRGVLEKFRANLEQI